MAASDAHPFAEKNIAYRVTFPIFDNTGSLVTGAAGLTPQISKDAGTFVNCTNAATEIATASGIYYLDLTATEMNANCVALIIKTSTTNAKTTPIILYPEQAGDIRVNVTQVNGTTQTARDIGASVLISPGTGTGQLDVTSGVVKANLVQIIATVLTETVAGYLSASFKKLFDVTSPSLTAASINQTGDNFVRIGSAGAGLTALGDTRIANLDAAVSSRSTYAGADTSGVTTLLSRLGTPVGASISADIATRSTYAGTDTSGVTTLLSRVGTPVGTLATDIAESYLRRNTAQAGAAATITLDAGASAQDSLYVGDIIAIISGTGIGQSRQITAYVGATKVATVSPSWTISPSASSIFQILPSSVPVSVASVVAGVWDEPIAGHLTAGTTGNKLNGASAGDPWVTALPGAYGAGTAGNLVGNNINASIAAVKAKTDQLVFTTANKVDSAFNVAADFPQVCADKTWASTVRTLSAAGVQAIWDALTSALTTAGSIGQWITSKLDVVVSTRSTYAGADTSGVTTLLSRLGTPVGASISADIATRSTYAGADTSGVTTLLSRVGTPVGASISADIATRSTYAGADTSGVTTLLSRVGTPVGASISADIAERYLARGTTVAGGVNTIMFDNAAAAQDSIYVGDIVVIIGGPGFGQSRQISAYIGATRTATISPNWTTNPTSSSIYQLLPGTSASSSLTVGAIASAVWDELIAGHLTAGTTGNKLNGAASAGDP